MQNDRNILPKKGSYFYPSWPEEGLSQRENRTAHASWAQLRPSNLLEGLGVCQVILHSLPASPQMTGEWTRPQGGLRVITLAELLLSSDCVTGTENPEKENKRLTK